MFLADRYPEIGSGANEAMRLATLERWEEHHSKNTNGTPETHQNWAEHDATIDAIEAGWTSGDPALDMTIAVSHYTDFLDTFGRPVAEARRTAFSGLVRDALATPSGELVATVNRVKADYSARVIVRMGLFEGVLPRVVRAPHRQLSVVVPTSGEFLLGNNGAIWTVGEDLPVHGLFKRDGNYSNTYFLTVDDMQRRTLLDSQVTGKCLPVYQILIGNDAVRTLFGQTISRHNVNAHDSLITTMAAALGVSLEVPAPAPSR